MSKISNSPTIIRSAIQYDGDVALLGVVVTDMNPFTARFQAYEMGLNSTTVLVESMPYGTEAAAIAKFDHWLNLAEG